MTWAQRLRRLFGIDIETCQACGGAVKIIACIGDQDVIEKTLTHLDEKTPDFPRMQRLPSRASPQLGLFE